MPRSVLLLSLDLAAGGVRAGDGSDKITVRELLRRGGGRHLTTAHTPPVTRGLPGRGHRSFLVSARFATDGVFILYMVSLPNERI